MIKELELQKAHLVTYLLSKVTTEDWHAVADAAMDLREIEAKIEILELLQKNEQKK
jgi:hypothetical protein